MRCAWTLERRTALQRFVWWRRSLGDGRSPRALGGGVRLDCVEPNQLSISHDFRLPRRGRVLFTSESVTDDHWDKLCDAIADAVLNDGLANDPDARCAVEVAVMTGLVVILGEMTTKALRAGAGVFVGEAARV